LLNGAAMRHLLQHLHLNPTQFSTLVWCGDVVRELLHKHKEVELTVLRDSLRVILQANTRGTE
jgi:hypothetical protein